MTIGLFLGYIGESIFIREDMERNYCRIIVSSMSEDLARELYNITYGYKFFGCEHWFDDMINRVSTKLNINKEFVNDALWCLCYLKGKCLAPFGVALERSDPIGGFLCNATIVSLWITTAIGMAYAIYTIYQEFKKEIKSIS